MADNADSQFSVSLDARGYEIFCAFPVYHFTGQHHGQVDVANLGLLGKMTGCAAISSNSIEFRENKRIVVDTNLKSLGTLGELLT